MSENKLNFEEKLKELEKILERLEGNDCSLEESIELFEKGMRLSADCKKVLDDAEKRIAEFSQKSE
jgi:exodeoxyribonuclease VII small subunit